ncbi:MAG: hypothetical protein AB7F35_20560 [Acetobacteraceae bacterium]
MAVAAFFAGAGLSDFAGRFAAFAGAAAFFAGLAGLDAMGNAR